MANIFVTTSTCIYNVTNKTRKISSIWQSTYVDSKIDQLIKYSNLQVTA